MVLKTLRNLWFLVTVLIVLASCQGKGEKQLIVYVSDFQTWVMNPDGTETQLALDISFPTRGIMWSPDGTRMIFTANATPNRASLWIANADGSEPHQLSDEFSGAIWLTNEILIARKFEEDQNVSSVANYVFDLRDQTMQLYSYGYEDIIPFPSSARWLTLNGFSGFLLHNIDGNTRIPFPRLFPTSAQAFDVAPSEQAIIICHNTTSETSRGGLYRAILDQGELGKPNLVYPLDGCLCVRWSPDGRYIALLDNQNVLYILDATTFSLLRSFYIGPLITDSFIWSPDSKFVAVRRHYGEPGPGPKEIARVNVETKEIVRLTENESVEYLTDWVSLPLR
ncbi:MAG: hypothetical protein GY832_44825 [Chloroflexi bacterium]|nr:hypothetical protein [Chloroflexota bacterium]